LTREAEVVVAAAHAIYKEQLFYKTSSIPSMSVLKTPTLWDPSIPRELVSELVEKKPNHTTSTQETIGSGLINPR
jgi:hypothetical protein